jgi:oligopeptide transport system substrate-binding protein
MLRRLASLLCLLPAALALLVFAACKKRETPVERGNREGILHLSVGSEPSDLDPHTVTGLGEAKLVQTLFDPLVSFEPGTLAPVPALAAKWDISPDGLTYTFHLRPDAKWSDGSPLTAQDCVDSWRRILTPTLAADYAYFLYLLRGAEAYHRGQTTDFSTVGAVARDPHTLVVTLTHPAPYFLQALLNSCWRPVNVRAIAAVGDPYRRGTPWTRPGKLVSSGPFTLKEWTPQQRIVVEKSPTYYDRDRVRLNAVHLYPTDSIDAEERAFRSGQLHITYSLPLAKVLPAQRENNPALRIDRQMETYFFRLNVRKPPLTDPRIRRALALAVDRDTIAGKILPGGRTPASSFVPPLLPGYTPPPGQRHDLATARQLLAAAGYPGGTGLPPIEILYNNSEILRLVAEAIQEMWRRDLGIDARLVNQEYKSVFASRRAGDYQVLLGSWTADYLDPTTFLDLWRSDSGNNHTGWADPAYDALSNRANTLADPAARATVLAEAEALVLDSAPIIPLYHNTHVYFLSPSVKGWQPTPTDHSDFRYVWLEAAK